MKQVLFLLLLCAVSCKEAGQKNEQAAKDAASQAAEALKEEQALAAKLVSELTIQDGGAVVPDPIVKVYTLQNSNPEGDLKAVTFSYKEFNKTKTLVEGTCAVPMDVNEKAYTMLEQITAIENGKTIEPQGKPCVGKQGTDYVLKYFNGKASKFTVSGGASCEQDKLPVPLKDLNAFVQNQAAALKSEMGLSIYKKIVDKMWLDTENPERFVEFSDGAMRETIKGVASPPAFVRFSDGCKGSKPRGDGMSAGNLGCITVWAQDEVEYMIIGLGDKDLEFIQVNTTGAKPQSFTRARKDN